MTWDELINDNLWLSIEVFLNIVSYYKNSSGDEIVSVNFFYGDIAHILQNTNEENLFCLTNRW